MILNFKAWLFEQQHRKDPIGELARTPSLQDPDIKTSQQKRDEHKIWATIIVHIPRPGIVEDFNEAWQEYLLAKEAAESPVE